MESKHTGPGSGKGHTALISTNIWKILNLKFVLLLIKDTLLERAIFQQKIDLVLLSGPLSAGLAQAMFEDQCDLMLLDVQHSEALGRKDFASNRQS